jgi:hypothetical protein
MKSLARSTLLLMGLTGAFALVGGAVLWRSIGEPEAMPPRSCPP